MTLAIRVFLFLLIFYFVFSVLVGDFEYLKKFLVKYIYESLVMLVLFGVGIFSTAKLYAARKSFTFFHQLVYYFSKEQLKEHPIFKSLQANKKKDRIYDFDDINTIALCNLLINSEMRMCNMFLKSTLDYFEKTHKTNIYTDSDVVKIFEKEFKTEREIIYDRLLKNLVEMNIENAEIIKRAYKNEMETLLQPIYKNFLLLGNGKYSLYRSIDLILNQFWIVYLSIDVQIVRIFRRIEESIIYKKEKNNVRRTA